MFVLSLSLLLALLCRQLRLSLFRRRGGVWCARPSHAWTGARHRRCRLWWRRRGRWRRREGDVRRRRQRWAASAHRVPRNVDLDRRLHSVDPRNTALYTCIHTISRTKCHLLFLVWTFIDQVLTFGFKPRIPTQPGKSESWVWPWKPGKILSSTLIVLASKQLDNRPTLVLEKHKHRTKVHTKWHQFSQFRRWPFAPKWLWHVTCYVQFNTADTKLASM